MRNNYLLALISTFWINFAFAFAFAFAGGVDGGGGKSVVCRNAEGKILKAELLDLFEGRVQYQLKYVESPTPWREQGESVITNSGLPKKASDPSFEIIDWFQSTTEHMVIVPDDVVLNTTDDSFEVITPRGCNIEQAANYQNDNTILINGEIWNAFSETQKAALVIHEASYRYLREQKEKNSKRARHLTAHIVSGQKVDPPHGQGQYNNVVAQCYGMDGTSLTITSFIDSLGKEKNRLYFESLAGRNLFSVSYADIESVDSKGTVFIDELKRAAPTDGAPERIYRVPFKTESLFEPGDKFWLSAITFEDRAAKVQFEGVSAVDGSKFKSDVSCIFLRD